MQLVAMSYVPLKISIQNDYKQRKVNFNIWYNSNDITDKNKKSHSVLK